MRPCSRVSGATSSPARRIGSVKAGVRGVALQPSAPLIETTTQVSQPAPPLRARLTGPHLDGALEPTRFASLACVHSPGSLPPCCLLDRLGGASGRVRLGPAVREE